MTSPDPRRPSPAVYRRRRLMVGVLAVVLVLLLWWLISTVSGWFTDQEEPEGPAATAEPTSEADSEGGEDDAGGSSAGQDDASETDDADEPEDAGQNGESTDEEDLPEGACAPGDVAVTASTGEDSYAPNEAPLLIMEIEHTGGEQCALDVGTGQQEFSISREGREVFTTAQCGDGGSEESYELEMEPGQTERAQLNWPRSDSSQDCTEPAELVPGGYELVASLGGIASEPHEFTLQEE